MTAKLIIFVALCSTCSAIPTDEQRNDMETQIKRLVMNQEVSPGQLLRLAWHDSATWDDSTKTGGAHASMRLDFGGSDNAHEGGDPNNLGQNLAIGILDPIYEQYKDSISHSDLWVLAANTAIQLFDGPKLETRFGRNDAQSPEEGIATSPGRPLPDAEVSSDEDTQKSRETAELGYLMKYFDKFGFDDTKRALATLIGGHTLGECFFQNSGFNGSWTTNKRKFNNGFYLELLDKHWHEVVNENVNYPQFGVKHQFLTADLRLMMLHADFSLQEDPEILSIMTDYYNDEQAFFGNFSIYWTELTEKTFLDSVPSGMNSDDDGVDGVDGMDDDNGGDNGGSSKSNLVTAIVVSACVVLVLAIIGFYLYIYKYRPSKYRKVATLHQAQT